MVSSGILHPQRSSRSPGLFYRSGQWFHRILPSRSPNEPKFSLLKSKVVILMFICISLRFLNSAISRLMLLKLPSTFTEALTSSKLVTNPSVSNRFSRLPPLVGSLNTCVKKLFLRHSKNLPDYLHQTMLPFQQMMEHCKSSVSP